MFPAFYVVAQPDPLPDVLLVVGQLGEAGRPLFFDQRKRTQLLDVVADAACPRIPPRLRLALGEGAGQPLLPSGGERIERRSEVRGGFDADKAVVRDVHLLSRFLGRLLGNLALADGEDRALQASVVGGEASVYAHEVRRACRRSERKARFRRFRLFRVAVGLFSGRRALQRGSQLALQILLFVFFDLYLHFFSCDKRVVIVGDKLQMWRQGQVC